MRYVVDPKLGGPAAIAHDGVCDKIYVNPIEYFRLPNDQRAFVDAHELAHCQHNVFSEKKADRIALKSIVKQGYLPEVAQETLENVLTGYPEHESRITAMQNYINQQYPHSQFTGVPYGYSQTVEQAVVDSQKSNRWSKEDIFRAAEVFSDIFEDIFNGNDPAPAPTPTMQSSFNLPTIIAIVAVIGLVIVIALKR